MSNVPLLDNFVENLQRAMDANDISGAELARRSGVHFVTISRILHGKLAPSVPVCERLATAAGMRADTAFLQPEPAASK